MSEEFEPLLEIKSGIPIPEPRGTKRSVFSRTLAKMEIGQCIDLPHSESNRVNVAKKAKQAGLKIACRSVIEDGQKILRVWRIAEPARQPPNDPGIDGSSLIAELRKAAE